jgi:predicted membrane protein
MASFIEGKRLWGGSLLLLTGLFYLFYNLNLLPFEVPTYVFTWQMAVILIGVYALYRSFFKGLILISVGVYFILPLMGAMPPIDIVKMWPLLLILLGLSILFGSRFKKKNKKRYMKNYVLENPKNEINEGSFDITTILGGDSRQISSYDFKGGKITAIMGGVELDLTNCYLSKDGCVIDLEVVMGGISLKVSREWNIKSEIVPIMSGIEDHDLHSRDVRIDPAALLILRGNVVMGGIEIKRI